MSLDDLTKLAVTQTEEKRPNWVSDNNSSAAAYAAIQSLNDERLSYILNHVLPADFRKKSNWQISVHQVANRISKSVPTLIGTRVKFAQDLKRYLSRINAELEKEKESHLAKYQRKPKSGGIKRKKKSLLEEENQKLRTELEQLKGEIIAAKVAMTFEQMPLDLKRKLGLV